MECNHGYPVSTTIISALASQRIDIRPGFAVRIAPQTKPVWAKFGDSTVVATAGAANEIFCPIDVETILPRASHQTHVAIIEDAATADGSVTVLG